MASLGDMVVNITGNSRGLDSELNGIQQRASRLGGIMSNALSVAGGMVVSQGLNAIADGFMNAATAGINYNSTLQQNTAAFKVMLGSADKAKAMLADLEKFASTTPFELPHLTKSAQTMLQFGINAEKIMPNVKMLGDVAMGDANKLQSLTLAFSQVQASGKLMGNDLLQFINAGFNPLQIISEKTGKSMGVLRDEMSKGAISADMVADAFKTATSEGGLFYGAMEEQSKTFAGQMSTLADNFNKTMGKVMKPLFDWLSTTGIPILSNLVGMIGSIDFGSIFGGIDLTGFQASLAGIGLSMQPLIQQYLPLLRNLFNSIATNIMPIVNQMFGYFAQNILPILAQIMGFIETKVIPELVSAWTELMPQIAAVWQEVWNIVKPLLDQLVINFKIAWPLIQQVVMTAIQLIKGLISGLLQSLTGLIQFVSGVLTGDWSRAWEGIKNIFGGVWKAINTLLGGAVQQITTSISTLINNIVMFFQGLPNRIIGTVNNLFTVQIPRAIGYGLGLAVAAVANGVRSIINFFAQLPSRVMSIWNSIVAFLRGLPARLISIWNSIIASVQRWFASMTSQSRSGSQGVFNTIVAVFSTLPSRMLKIGSNIIQGLINGIRNMAGSAVGAIVRVGKNMLSGFMDALRMQSPSKEFQKAGQNIGQGVIKGIEDKKQKIADAIKSMAELTMSKAKSIMDFGGMFNNVDVGKFSGTKFIKSMKNQVSVLKEWQKNLGTIGKRAGRFSKFYNELLQMGPSAAGEIKAIASMNDKDFKQYQSLYNQKTGIANAVGGRMALYEQYQKNRAEQIVINISGNHISSEYDVDKIAQRITQKLKLAGVY